MSGGAWRACSRHRVSPGTDRRENIFLNGACAYEIRQKFDEISRFCRNRGVPGNSRQTTRKRHVCAAGVCGGGAPGTEILIIDEVLTLETPVFQQKCIGKMAVARTGRTVLSSVITWESFGGFAVAQYLPWDGRLEASGSVDQVVGKLTECAQFRKYRDPSSTPRPGRQGRRSPDARRGQ